MTEPTSTLPDKTRKAAEKLYREKIVEWFNTFKEKGRVQLPMPGSLFDDHVKWGKIRAESYERYVGQGWVKFLEIKRFERVKEMIRWRILSQVIARCEMGEFTDEDWLGIIVEAKNLCLLDYWRKLISDEKDLTF